MKLPALAVPHFWTVFLSTLLGLMSCDSGKPPKILLAEQQLPDKVDFNFHVKPILADRCFACHGPDEANREAGLRLDDSAAAFAELPESPGKYAIIPGKLARSEVFHRILSENPDMVMPPPDSKLSLSEEEKAVLIRWIEQGAEYKPHWAFMPIEAKDLSSDEQHPIDHFIRKQLEQQHLESSPKASKEVLIRRLSFDLTGLPPSLEEIDAFVADESPYAYEKLADRLLSSPNYGERMAAHWLDVARYADSDGYLDDKHRDVSPWRDWVIQAFNENLPYDQFVSWQLAGDLLPNPTQEQILATAFNRLHKKNSEAGIVFEEYRVEYTADRTNTFGKAFLGLSLECARCHDHKYDPISQKDYYRLFGFFNQTNEWGHAVYGPDQTPGPALLLTDEETEQQLTFLQSLEQQHQTRLEQQPAQAKSRFQIWKKQYDPQSDLQSTLDQALISHISFDQIQAVNQEKGTSPDLQQRGKRASLNRPLIRPGIKGDAFFVTDYNSGAFPKDAGWFERTDAFSLDLWLYPDTTYEQASILTHCEDRRLGLKGYSVHLRDNHPLFIMAHSWPQNAIQIVATEALPTKTWSRLTITYDGSSTAEGTRLYLNGSEMKKRVEVDNLYKGILFEWNIHTYGFHGLQFGYRNKLIPFKKGGLDEIKIFDRALTALEVMQLHLGEIPETIVSSESPILKEHYLQRYDPSYLRLRDSLNRIRAEKNEILNQVQEIMVMGDTSHHRPTYLLNRGSYQERGEAVLPGVPEQILSVADSLPNNRLGLAKWLFDPDHPLTSRVIVNRIWQLHFGHGLVKTSEDFGSQGALPTHPELLDWLANWFIESDWDLKALHKLIVMSETYQQSSVIQPELQERDPENIWLARGPRFRLSAEMIRDNALAISKLLINRVGGTSVYPYQPAGLWDEISNKPWRYPYLQEPGEGLYRRSIYTIWKRTAPPPSMLIFDIADRDNCTVRRKLTSTPLQALVLLNDPQYQEAARVASEHILKIAEDDLSKLTHAFRLVCGRTATASELERLQLFLQGERQYYEDHPEDALAYLEVGEAEWDRDLAASEIASLGVTINSLMNTDEAFTRN